MAALKNVLTIASLHDGFVRCSGRFKTADGKGMHSLLQPQVHHSEMKATVAPKVGDLVFAYEDGTYEHRVSSDAA